ncbi:MAG: hypothetical protein LBN30_01680 [Oscillospiraceae bacterium]|nr:hypothetical protein [Oscillospiraceae bacterium]
MYILGATEADIGINPAYGASDPAAKRVYDAAISIFKYGVSKASEGIQEPEIIITADRTYPTHYRAGTRDRDHLKISAISLFIQLLQRNIFARGAI